MPLSGQFGVVLYDLTGTALDAEQLAGVPFDLAAWAAQQHFEFALSDPNDPTFREASLNGRVEAISRVPEPLGGLLGTLRLRSSGAGSAIRSGASRSSSPAMPTSANSA